MEASATAVRMELYCDSKRSDVDLDRADKLSVSDNEADLLLRVPSQTELSLKLHISAVLWNRQSIILMLSTIHIRTKLPH